MAQVKFIDSSDFEMVIAKAIDKYPEIAEKCLAAGAAIIADEMKKRLQSVLSPFATGELVEAFGITPTTVLWILPIVSRGLIVGIVAKLWKKKSGDTGIVEKKNPTVFFVVCIVTAIIHSILNTLALYVDSKMFGYYSYALVFGALFVRLLSSVITAIIMALTIKMVVHALKKASLI